MKRIQVIFLTLVLLVAATIPAGASNNYPYFIIESVTKDQTVTIRAYNFPANDTFLVSMGYYGTYGIGGIQVGSTSTGIANSFVATYSIPSALVGQYRIAIRLESPSSGYYAYNWFYNNTAPTSQPPVNPPTPGYSGYPYFFIKSVLKDKTVTIQAYNFPGNDTFVVKMGSYGGYGIGGIVVGTTATNTQPGPFEATYTIPSELSGLYRIAIRLESPSSGYFAYTWFYNNTFVPGQKPTEPVGGYQCCPYFFIKSVVRDKSVTINAYNFSPNDTYLVTMGPYGTYGIGGYAIATTTTDEKGNFTATYQVPNELAGAYQIAIRLQSPNSGYFGYNWFYNNTTVP